MFYFYNKGNHVTWIKLFILLIFCIFNSNCALINSSSVSNKVISSLTTYETSLTKSDVAKDFCNNLTEYFNTYEYYRIETEVFRESDKQNYASSSNVIKRGNIIDVEYQGSAGWYSIYFSNSEFSGSKRIVTFRRSTVGGNAIRNEVYDTFFAWYNRVELAKKANENDFPFRSEQPAALEVERWFNSFIN
jgi:hypothetical protein